MKVTAVHVIAFLVVVLPAIAVSLQQTAPPGSKLAVAGAVLGAVSLALTRSAIGSVNTKAALEGAATTEAASVAKDLIK